MERGERRGTTITYRLDATVVEETIGAVMELFAVGEGGGGEHADERTD